MVSPDNIKQVLASLCLWYKIVVAKTHVLQQIVTDSSALSRLSREALVSLLERRDDWRSIRATVLPQFGPGAAK